MHPRQFGPDGEDLEHFSGSAPHCRAGDCSKKGQDRILDALKLPVRSCPFRATRSPRNHLTVNSPLPADILAPVKTEMTRAGVYSSAQVLRNRSVF